jgi:hypothetical protein
VRSGCRAGAAAVSSSGPLWANIARGWPDSRGTFGPRIEIPSQKRWSGSHRDSGQPGGNHLVQPQPAKSPLRRTQA